MNRSILIAAALVSSFSLPAFAGSSSTAGVPNPAAVGCTKLGGAYVIYDSPEGQDGLCRFDRAEIGGWTLYNALHQDKPLLAVQAFFAHVKPVPHRGTPGRIGMPNPSSVYCTQVGGKINIVTDAQGGQTGICSFRDHSEIEEWTLFGGPKAPGNADLAKILKQGTR